MQFPAFSILADCCRHLRNSPVVRLRLLLLWLGWWHCHTAMFAQSALSTESFRFYSVNHGLSNRFITNIVQTRDGFIWLGTDNGLNRFDGYNFVVFSNKTDLPNRISGFNIEYLGLTHDDHLIITYRNNLQFFDLLHPQTYEATKVNLSPENGIKGIVRQITTTRQGDILVLTSNATSTWLYRYKSNQQFQQIFERTDRRERQVAQLRLLALQNGQYLLSDEEIGLRLLDAAGKVVHAFRREAAVATDTSRQENPITLLYQDTKDRIWVAFRHTPGVFLLSDRYRLERYGTLPLVRPYTMLKEDRKGNLLFAQNDPTTTYSNIQKLICLKADGEIQDYTDISRPTPRIISLFSTDFTKTVFLGIDSGLKIVQNNISQVKTFLTKPISEEQRGNIMRGITGDECTIYFGDEAGLWYSMDPFTDRLDTLRLIDEATGAPLEMDCVMNMQIDPQGNLWGIACNSLRQGQLIRYNPTTRRTSVFRFPHIFRAFTRAANGTFWVLYEAVQQQESGLLAFDPTTESFQLFRDQQGKNPLSAKIPYYIIESRDKKLWIGTNSGLLRIDPLAKAAQVYQVPRAKSTEEALQNSAIIVIHEDVDGQLWLGTISGLSVLDPQSGNVVTYTNQNGLASNTVCGIVADGKNNFWISTYYGLSYFDRPAGQFRNFFRVDGLSHDEFNRFSFFRDVRGRYYFGGVNGLNTFYAQDLLQSETTPRVAFARLSRYHIRKDSIFTQYNKLMDGSRVEISPYDAYFQVYFMLPKFNNPDRNQFSAWLEGYEKNWTYLGNTPFIRYNSLPPGNYTLHIKGADPNGNWSQEAASLQISVRRIFYRTSWFWLLVMGLLSGLAYWFFRYQWEQKLQVERFRTKLSSDLHDELSGLLSGIAMQTDMLQMTTPDENIRERLRNIGEVSRKAMSKMSDVIWSIDARKDKMDDLIRRMYEHADDILLPLNIQYAFETRKIDPQQSIPPTIRQELYLIFKESVNNIAKHSSANQVKIKLMNTEGMFVLEVHDNGQSSAKPLNGSMSSHAGQGLSNIKMRARRINAKLEITKNQGYTVKLSMRRFA
ncbi:MAG TPA: two-component regulator propeller domain-containing protein [Saprospiraceae bacterium]|nr:two-component regulator propeller domain-containing protein [Saprospiraceae bacterium]HMP24871.1 two-component regulator propeller domain-containing protein [Saprospiraceae bacterium]